MLRNEILNHRRCSRITRAEGLLDSLIVFRVHGVQQSEEGVRASQNLRKTHSKLSTNLLFIQSRMINVICECVKKKTVLKKI